MAGRACKQCRGESLDAPRPRPNLFLVRPNPNLYPEGGYFFVEGDGSQFRGESWRDLIAKVTAYRERNKRAVGDVESEVFTQYCQRMPSHCKQMPKGGGSTTNSHHSMSLNQKVLQWVAGMLDWKRRAAIPRVQDEEAARRAAICANCPRMKPLVESCEMCIKALKDGRRAILDGAASYHQGLLACDALGEDCQTTVHIEQPKADESLVPANCWRK